MHIWGQYELSDLVLLLKDFIDVEQISAMTIPGACKLFFLAIKINSSL